MTEGNTPSVIAYIFAPHIKSCSNIVLFDLAFRSSQNVTSEINISTEEFPLLTDVGFHPFVHARST